MQRYYLSFEDSNKGQFQVCFTVDTHLFEYYTVLNFHFLVGQNFK